MAVVPSRTVPYNAVPDVPRSAVPDDDDELARELASTGAAPRSASDPIGLLVQLTSLRSRSRSSYVHIKMPSLLLLRQFAGERQYRVGG